MLIFSPPIILLDHATLTQLERNGTLPPNPTSFLPAVLSISDADLPPQQRLICQIRISIENPKGDVSTHCH